MHHVCPIRRGVRSMQCYRRKGVAYLMHCRSPPSPNKDPENVTASLQTSTKQAPALNVRSIQHVQFYFDHFSFHHSCLICRHLYPQNHAHSKSDLRRPYRPVELRRQHDRTRRIWSTQSASRLAEDRRRLPLPVPLLRSSRLPPLASQDIWALPRGSLPEQEPPSAVPAHWPPRPHRKSHLRHQDLERRSRHGRNGLVIGEMVEKQL